MIDPTAPKPHNLGDVAKLDPKEIKRDLEQQVPSVRNLPEADRARIVRVVAERTEMISGPIPSAHELQKYNLIAPDLVNRIVAMAESDQKHDQTIQQQVMDSEIAAQHRDHVYRLSSLGIALVALVGMMCLVGFLAVKGQPILAGLFGLGGMAAIVGKFINGRSTNNIEKPLKPETSAKPYKKKK